MRGAPPRLAMISFLKECMHSMIAAASTRVGAKATFKASAIAMAPLSPMLLLPRLMCFIVESPAWHASPSAQMGTWSGCSRFTC